MKYRATIIGLIILLALGAYVYFYERTPMDESPTGEIKITLIPGLDINKVREFSIIGMETTQVIICTRNQDSSWSIRSPVKAKADNMEIETFLNDFKNLKSERVLKENLLSLSSYGLENPDKTIMIKTKDETVKLSIGGLNPDGSNYYLKKNDNPGIYLVTAGSVNRWNKTATDFRDKTVIELDTGKVSQLNLFSRDGNYTFIKEKEGWMANQPGKIELDQYKIEDLIWKLRTARIREFIDETGQDLQSYGLDKPLLTAEIKTNEGKLYTLFFGNKLPDSDLIYARVSDKSFFFTLDTSLYQSLILTDLDKLRNRDLFHIMVDDIQSIEIQSTTKLYLTRKKEDWYIQGKPDKKADPTKMEDILWKINGVQIKEFIEDKPADLKKYGLTHPIIKSTLTDKNKKIYTLLLGNLTPTGDAVYAKTNLKDNIYSLDTEIRFDLSVTEKELLAVDTILKNQ